MEKEANFKDKKLVYRVYGSGPAVVLLHGFGENGSIWNKLLNGLTEYRFIIPELPGNGGSEIVDDMSMEGLADWVCAILKEEAIVKCVLIGHSMGGYITLSFVAKYPAMLSGFGLFHSTAFADSEEKIATRKKGIAFIREKGAFSFLKTTIPNLYAPATKTENEALLQEHVSSVQNSNDAALIQYYTAMIQREDRTDILKETLLPVLFIFGKWDTAVPLEDGLKQCHLPQLSYIHILNNSGHMGMVEEPEKSVQIINEFLAATI